MNLFKKALIAVLSVGLVTVPSTIDRVEANTTDDSKEKWSAIGTINGTSWNTDFDLAYDSADDRYELQIVLNANEEFKIRLDKSWSKSIGYGGNTGAGISTYLSNSGGNFKVKTSGTYLLWVKDDKVANYGDNSYGFGIEAVTAEYFTVTHYSKDGTVLSSEEVIEKSTYNPKFEEVEGFMLEGWYTEESLTNKLEKGAQITSDLDLYPNYVECKDYTVYFDDNGTLGTTVYAYMYRDTTDGGTNAAWPGVALEKDANGLWKVEVDASKTFTKIIFNGGEGKEQTANLDLTYEDTLYTIGSKNSGNGNKYDATSTSVVAGKAANLSVHYQENGTSLRIISTLGAIGDETFSLDSYTNVGFRFENAENSKEVNSGFVYTSVIADGETISANNYSAQYFFVTTFNNVPAGTTLTVTPYATLANGFVYYGTSVSVTVSY